MMKNLFLWLLSAFMLCVATFDSVKAQGWDDKISWKFTLEKVDDRFANIVATAQLKDGWHVFSVTHDPEKADFTGIPTTFIFPKSSDFKPIGKLIDGLPPKKHNDELGLSIYFEKKAVFKQKIEVLTDKAFDLVFEYSFQICDENGCIFPPDQEAKIKVSGFKPVPGAAVDPSSGAGSDSLTAIDTAVSRDNSVGDILAIQEEVFPEDKPGNVKDINIWLIFLRFCLGFCSVVHTLCFSDDTHDGDLFHETIGQ